MMKYDTYLPIGCDCIPAYYLKQWGLRTEAYPLDWMGFSSSTMIHLFETGFSDYFSVFAEEEPYWKSTCRYIRDTANDILSVHHFPLNQEISDVLEGFHATMRKRYLRVNSRLMNSHTLLMLGSHQETEEQLEDSLIRFSRLYPHLTIRLVNVHHCENMTSLEYRQRQRDVNDHLTMICFYLNNQRDTVNNKHFDIWGNEELWNRFVAAECK